MEKIICFINLFTANARAYMIDSNDTQNLLGEIPLEELEEKLADLSNLTDIHHITLIGAPTYADGIVPEILQYAKTKYSNNELIVEVMR